MRKLCNVVPCVGMRVVSLQGIDGRVISCVPKPIGMYGDDETDYVTILWNTGKQSHAYLFEMRNVDVNYTLPEM